MVKETQKAKIERLENELLQAHKVMDEQRQCINNMQAVANDGFANSNDKKQLKDKIQMLEMKLKSSERAREHAEKLAKAKDKRLQELEQQIAELKSELEKGVHNLSSINEHKKLGRKTKFDDIEVEKIKKLRATGKSYREIATYCNCSVGLVHKIINNQKDDRSQNKMNKYQD